MSGNVVINGLTAVHGSSGGKVIAPDVCMHPCDGCCAAVYTNVAKSGSTSGAAGSVLVNGKPMAHINSNFSSSSGDAGGSCGGVSSGTTQQKAQFLTSSPNVLVEGKPAVRQTDLMVSNLRNTPPMPLMQPGAGMPKAVQLGSGKSLQAAQDPDDYAWDGNSETALGTIKPHVELGEDDA